MTPLIIAVQVTLIVSSSESGYTSSVLLYVKESVDVYIVLFFIIPFTNQVTSVNGSISLGVRQ